MLIKVKVQILISTRQFCILLELIKSFGYSENVAFYGPFGLAVDKNRTVYISENELDRVHVFNYFP